MKQPQCPYRVGDRVRFTPSERTRSLYQDIERFGVTPGEVYAIAEVRDDCYLYFSNGSGGWPWNEFSAVVQPLKVVFCRSRDQSLPNNSFKPNLLRRSA